MPAVVSLVQGSALKGSCTTWYTHCPPAGGCCNWAAGARVLKVIPVRGAILKGACGLWQVGLASGPLIGYCLGGVVHPAGHAAGQEAECLGVFTWPGLDATSVNPPVVYMQMSCHVLGVSCVCTSACMHSACVTAGVLRWGAFHVLLGLRVVRPTACLFLDARWCCWYSARCLTYLYVVHGSMGSALPVKACLGRTGPA